MRYFFTAMFAIAGLVAATEAQAQPHMPRTNDHVEIPTPELDVWLRRMVGRFTFDGMIKSPLAALLAGLPGGGPDCDTPGVCSAIKGKGECIAIGDGPGVQCIFNATWLYELNPYLDPAMLLFGIDPGKMVINLLLVNDKGLSTHEHATVKGHFGLFRRCPPGVDTGYCGIDIRVEAKPDANLNYMWFGDDGAMVLALRRVQPGSEAEARWLELPGAKPAR